MNLIGQLAQNSLLLGTRQLSEMVLTTMGPYGRTVVIQGPNGDPHITKDGVTVAKAVKSENPSEDIGIQILRQASLQTAKKAGDGTTTTIALATGILNQLDKIKSTTNTFELKRNIEKVVQDVIDIISKSSEIISSDDEIYNIALLSSNGDTEIANLILESYKHVGPKGTIMVEESRSGNTELELIDGVQFNRGYKSPYFVTNNDSMTAVLEDSYILLSQDPITSVKDLAPILSQVSEKQKPILIIADDISAEVMAVLVLNKTRGALKVAAVKAPEFGERKVHYLNDIGIMTGAKVFSKEKGVNLVKGSLADLGEARKVTVSSEDTTIIGGKGNDEEIVKRIGEIEQQITNSKSDFEREKLNERLAALSGSVALICIGAATEVEMKEKKDRVDDALHATKSAIVEGYIPGGGSSLLLVSHIIKSQISDKNSESLNLALDIISEAIKYPFNQILKNAGLDEYFISGVETLTLDNLKLTKSYKGSIYDLSTNQFVKWKKSGIFDPTKVTRLALTNAVSVALSILTTNGVIYYNESQNALAGLEQLM